jgi:uncharacterized membrane protein YsdA (DUF1294 family)
MSFATYIAFAWDKRRARNGEWRIPERTLLTLAATGGTLGALAARKFLRHKSRKQPFGNRLYLVIAVQLAAIGVLNLPSVQKAIAETLGQTVAAETPLSQYPQWRGVNR